MCDSQGALRRVAWSELLPWLMLGRALRLACSAPLLLSATAAVLLLPLGWQVSALLWEAPPDGPAVKSPQADVPLLIWQAGESPDRFAQPTWALPHSWQEFVAPMVQLLPGGVPPVRHLFRIGGSWSHFGYVATGTLWNVLVWAFFGGIIVRTAVMQLGREERIGLWDAARFAAGRYRALVAAPFFPLLAAAGILLCSIPVGWLMRWDFGMLLAGAAWLLVLLGGFLVAIILIGLLLGWPLMWAALSTEEMGDVFEAAQRSYSYTFGRPLHYAAYALMALVIGSTAFLAAQWFAAWVVYLSFWTVSWGAGSAPLDALESELSPGRLSGAALITWWSQLPFAIASAFRYAYFWTAAGAIYLLLRRDADQIDWDVVHAPDAAPPFALPPLSTDAAGVPGAAAGGPSTSVAEPPAGPSASPDDISA